MATIRRAGFGSVFEVENETVGIGTTGTATNTVQVLGETKASLALVTGLSTLTTYQGFVDNTAEFGNSNVDINSSSGTTGDIEICHGDFNVSSASTLTSSVNQLTVTNSFSVPTGDTDSRIHCHTAGSMRFNEDLGILEFYTGDEWKTVNSYRDVGNRGRGIFQGGREGTNPFSLIEYINISSLGNTITFGDSTNPCIHPRGMSNSIRGLFAGGYSPTHLDTIEYITIASEGNSIDFGDMSEELHAMATMSSSTRGIIAGGDTGPSVTNLIEYIEINTLGNTQDFGDLTGAAMRLSGGMNSTRGLILGGNATPSYGGGTMKNNFITMASKGNGVEFGTMNPDRGYHASASNSVRVLSGGGYNNANSLGLTTIDFITTASLGDAITFGDLRKSRYALGATGNETRAVFVGGTDGTTDNYNIMEFINFTSSGSTEDFGDLRDGRYGMSGLSDSHGGLGGF